MISGVAPFYQEPTAPAFTNLLDRERRAAGLAERRLDLAVELAIGVVSATSSAVAGADKGIYLGIVLLDKGLRYAGLVRVWAELALDGSGRGRPFLSAATYLKSLYRDHTSQEEKYYYNSHKR